MSFTSCFMMGCTCHAKDMVSVSFIINPCRKRPKLLRSLSVNLQAKAKPGASTLVAVCSKVILHSYPECYVADPYT